MQGCQTGEADRLALGRAAKHLRIAIGEEAAHIVADDIQTRDRVAIGLDSLKISVDADAVSK